MTERSDAGRFSSWEQAKADCEELIGASRYDEALQLLGRVKDDFDLDEPIGAVEQHGPVIEHTSADVQEIDFDQFDFEHLARDDWFRQVYLQVLVLSGAATREQAKAA